MFVCRKSKDDLIKANQTGTLKYIEWGEQQEYASGVQRGMKWPDGPWVRDRKPGWYALPESETHFSQLYITAGYGTRYIQPFCSEKIIADKRLYYLTPSEGLNSQIVASVLNSHITAFFIELSGRVSLGEGALELIVEDARDFLLIPDIRKFDQSSLDSVLAAFQLLLKRPIGNVFEEITKSDRQALDRAVLLAIGLDPEKWLLPIYDGLATLMRERIQLGQMRSQTRKSKPQKAARRVADEVLQDILPNGLLRFPDGFLSPAAKAGSFHDISLPVQYIGPMMGKEEVRAQDGHIFMVSNIFEVRFLLYCQLSDYSIAHVPDQLVEVSRAVNNFAQYIRDLRYCLRQTYFRRTFDQAAADRFVEETWRKYKLPDTEKN